METMELLPDEETMYRAFLEKDGSFEGLFVMGVKTTGIFCRPTCPARKPKRRNVEFFPRAVDALAAGYRPCLRCRPMEPAGSYPEWLKLVMDAVEQDPLKRWTLEELRAVGVDPARARRWFQATHGMTFLSYLRSRRVGQVFSRIKEGGEITDASLAADFDSVSGFCEALRRNTGQAPRASAERHAFKVGQMPSPFGPLLLVGDEEAVFLIEFWDRRMLETQFGILQKRLNAVLFPGSTEPIKRMRAELERYFAGDLDVFRTPIRYPGTELQEKVWRGLLDVPSGETWSYGGLARHIGKPKAVRAVARCVGENRLSIVIPCHRIVGADGNLTGYGGGLWRKRHLLELERRACHRETA